MTLADTRAHSSVGKRSIAGSQLRNALPIDLLAGITNTLSTISAAIFDNVTLLRAATDFLEIIEVDWFCRLVSTYVPEPGSTRVYPSACNWSNAATTVP